MSLLLEALKRAEKAKEEAQRRESEPASRGSDGEMRLAEEPAASAETRHVRTRDELPDISQPLEILSDDLAHAAPPNYRNSGTAQSGGSRASPERAPAARPAAAGAQRAERAAARSVFQAKMREPNPRLPFYVTLAALGVFAIGTVGYFWYQLRPPPSLANTNPGQPVNEQPTTLARTSATGTVVEAPPQPAIRGLPSKPAEVGSQASASRAQPERRADPSPAPARATTRPARPAAAARAPAPTGVSAGVPASDSASTAVAARTAASTRVHPQVEAGYAAYQTGELVLAREAYGRALREEPSNRDALLGLAAVETRSQRPEVAAALYARLLQADPRDAYAQAGMLALRGAPQDPVLMETRLKNLLAADPDANPLHFTLGNQYARQERWAEAQQAYFKAYTADPENPDFAYNLAVSLDRLHKPRVAAEYYQRALALAGRRGASFERAAVEKRVQELAR